MGELEMLSPVVEGISLPKDKKTEQEAPKETPSSAAAVAEAAGPPLPVLIPYGDDDDIAAPTPKRMRLSMKEETK